MSNEPEAFIPENFQTPPAAEKPRAKTNWPLLGGVSVIALFLGLWGAQAIIRSADPFSHHYSGQGWDYTFRDIELTAPLSGEMEAYNDRQFSETLSDLGGTGWDLVSVVPSPKRPADKGYCYRLLFKRPGNLAPPIIPGVNERRFDAEACRVAVEAESKARAKEFERQMDDIKNGRR